MQAINTGRRGGTPIPATKVRAGWEFLMPVQAPGEKRKLPLEPAEISSWTIWWGSIQAELRAWARGELFVKRLRPGAVEDQAHRHIAHVSRRVLVAVVHDAAALVLTLPDKVLLRGGGAVAQAQGLIARRANLRCSALGAGVTHSLPGNRAETVHAWQCAYVCGRALAPHPRKRHRPQAGVPPAPTQPALATQPMPQTPAHTHAPSAPATCCTR